MSAKELISEVKLIVSPSDRLSEVIPKMKENNVWTIPVLKGKVLVGLLSYKDLLSRRVSLDSKVSSVMSPTISLDENSDFTKIIGRFYTTKARVIPVIDNRGSLKGMITRESILKYLLDQKKIPENEKTRKYMSSPPKVVSPNESIAKVRWIMLRDKISRLPVLDGSKLVGIVTVRDVVNSLYSVVDKKKSSIMTEEERIMAMCIKEIIRYPVVTAKANESLKNALEKMLKHNVSGLPLIEGEEVVGVMSGIDVINSVAESMQLSIPIDAKIPMVIRKNSELKSEIDSIVERYLAKLEKISDIITFRISFKEEKGAKKGESSVYMATVRAVTKEGEFIAKDSDRDPVVAAKRAVEKIESRIIRNLKKLEDKNNKRDKAEKA
ncbi:CBS domain-containing protein [Sulfuracidifex metallicus]|uniref:CBS domain-containing protein n=1 Tax=Sulfuracidifex metallicus TaxID=47303 RepID=UPI00227663EA|nr:CBS domain-containing protein [Sulfuracidifex metallicus]MCY0850312.1 CBS domain-containing protein [Sulfuracidifex metallicus]